MTVSSDQYSHMIAELGLSKKQAARLLAVDPRTSRKWAAAERGMRGPGAQFLRYLIRTGTSGEQALRILE